MVLQRLTGSLFALGVLAGGTLAGASVFSGRATQGKEPVVTPLAAPPRSSRLTKPSVVENKTLAPSDPLPAFLSAADELWMTTHDSRQVRQMLRGTLDDLAVADSVSGRPSVMDIEREGPQLSHVADAASRRTQLVIVRMRRPVTISTRNENDRPRYSGWRHKWSVWRTSLNVVPRLSNGVELSASEMSIETW